MVGVWVLEWSLGVIVGVRDRVGVDVRERL